MKRVGKFEKVSLKQFIDDWKNAFKEVVTQDNILDQKITEIYDNIELPKRATLGSAGYDFFSPIYFTLPPGKSIKIPTGIRCKMEYGWMLQCYPRSGLGFKYRLQLDNTVGIIDSDYYYSDNEGHIFVKLTNDTKENKTINLDKGSRIAQGIFVEYGIVYDDFTEGIRNGGFGSTGGSKL